MNAINSSFDKAFVQPGNKITTVRLILLLLIATERRIIFSCFPSHRKYRDRTYDEEYQQKILKRLLLQYSR